MVEEVEVWEVSRYDGSREGWAQLTCPLLDKQCQRKYFRHERTESGLKLVFFHLGLQCPIICLIRLFCAIPPIITTRCFHSARRREPNNWPADSSSVLFTSLTNSAGGLCP